MATAKKNTAAAQRSRPPADRTIVYHGIKIPPIAGKRSPLSAVIREALFANARISGDDPPQARVRIASLDTERRRA